MQRPAFRVGSNDYDFLDLAAYFAADLALTASLVRMFGKAAKMGVPYDFEAKLFLNVVSAGTVTVNVGITGGSPTMRVQAIASSGAIPSITTNAGTGAVAVTTASFGTTGNNSILVNGSAYKTTADGTLFLDLSTPGNIVLLAGSTFKLWPIL